jgi:hypothetical protein
LGLGANSPGISEAFIRALVQGHPCCLPIAEIDPLFVNPAPVCRELSTPAGSIGNVMVTASGLPVLVEGKLWRNPEGRREVVGQILDCAIAPKLFAGSHVETAGLRITCKCASHEEVADR